jgi:hypothetical protein
VDDLEIPLEGGNVTDGVVRVGDTVRRPPHPNGPLAHAVLRHLADVGFRHSPRLLGTDDQGREMLTFAPGTTIWPHRRHLLDDGTAVAPIARLVRSFHDAMATFRADGDACEGTIVLHGDLAPWNVVVDDAGSWTLIDWDAVAPGPPAWDLAYVLYTFLPLWPDSPIVEDDAEIRRRIDVFTVAHGAARAIVDEALRLVPDRCRDVADRTEAGAAAGHPGFQRLVADGHPEGWRAGADHVAARLEQWLGR